MSDIEVRAREMGWRPIEEWKGPEANWKTAEDFVRIGENYMPVLKERLGKMEETISALREENTKVSGSLNKLAEHHRGTWKRMYEKAMNDIREQKKIAVQEADTQLYDALEEQEKKIIEEAAADNPDIPQGAGDTVPEYEEFRAANPWYGNDREMTMYANGLQSILPQDASITDDKTFFQEVEKRVRLRFPEKFRNDNQALPPLVEGSGGAGSLQDTAKRGWGDIPAEHQAGYLNNFTDIMSKDEYAAEYWLQDGV
jgi:hypothetical protein